MAEKRRKIRSESEARGMLLQQRQSGLSFRGWCEENAIDGRSLRSWENSLSSAPIRMIEVTPAQVASPPAQVASPIPTPRPPSKYVIRVRDVALEVSDDFSDETVSRLVKVLASC